MLLLMGIKRSARVVKERLYAATSYLAAHIAV
jgi:hypothetical protein